MRTLHRLRAILKRIFEYISVNASVDPKKKNVHNLLSRLRREAYAFPTIEERIRAILEDFPSKPGIVTRVHANDEVRYCMFETRYDNVNGWPLIL